MKKNYGWLIGVLLLTAGCHKNDRYEVENLDFQSLFTTAISPRVGPADTAFAATIRIEGLPENLAESDNKIILETDLGKFENGAKKIEITSSLQVQGAARVRIASTRLLSGAIPGTAHLKITLKDVSKTDSVVFTRAFPERLVIVVPQPAIKASFTDAFPIEVLLPRTTGIASVGTMVNLNISDTNGVKMGSLQQAAVSSNLEGKAPFRFFFSDTVYKGRLEVLATSDTPDKTLRDSLFLTIYK